MTEHKSLDIPFHHYHDDASSLTLSHVNHLKLALNKEKDISSYQRNITEDLRKKIDLFAHDLSSEKLISQLSLLSCTSGGGKDPFIIVNAVKELLFPTFEDSFELWCCIRTGEHWAVVRNSNKNDMESLGKMSINKIDGLIRTLQIGSLHVLSNVLSDDEINKIYADGSSNSKVSANYHHNPCMSKTNPRCVWLFWLTKGDDEQLREVSNVLSDYFSVIDAAGSITMAGLVHYIEFQEIYAEKLAGQAVTEVTKLLYKNTLIDDTSFSLLEQLQQIPLFLKTLIGMTNCDIFLFDGLHALSNNDQSGTRGLADDKIVAINTSLEVIVIDLSSDNPFKNSSILASAVFKQQSMCCFDSQNNIRNKSIDCGGLSLAAIIACPLWPTNSSGRLLAGGIVYRYEHSCPTSFDIRSMIAISSAIGPIIQTWFESTELEALSLLRQQPKSLASPFDGTGFSNANSLKLSDIEVRSVPSRVMDEMMIFYNKVVEDGLSGLINDCHSIQTIARTFDCDWALAILVPQSNNMVDNLDDELNLEIVNNVGMRRAFNMEEIDNFLKRTVTYMLQDQKSVNNEDDVEIIAGIDAENSGVLQLLNINSMRAAVLGALPAHLNHMLCFSVSDSLTSNNDNGIGKIIFIAGRNWRPFSRVALQPRVKSLIENVNAALECRYLRSMYKFTQIIQEKVLAMEYVKINNERIRLLEKGLEDIGNKYKCNFLGSEARKAFAVAVNRFCFQIFTLEEPEKISNAQYNQQSRSSIIIRDFINDKERIWLLEESGEWVLNQSLEKVVKETGVKLEHTSKLLTIFSDEISGKPIAKYSITLEILIQYLDENPNDIANLNDILLVQELRQRLEQFINNNKAAIFGCLEESQLINSETCDLPNLDDNPYSIKAIDNGVKVLGQVFSNGLHMDTAIASELLLKGVRNAIPQFLLFPVTSTGDKGGNVSIAFATNSSSLSYAQLPIRIARVLADDENNESKLKSQLNVLNEMGSIFHNFLLDCGIILHSNQNSILAVYRYFYRGADNRYQSAMFLAFSRCDLLVAPFHFQRLQHLLDCTLLPLQLNYIMNCFSTLLSSSTFILAMKESLEISQTNSSIQPTEASDRNENSFGERGFIEEAVDIVQKDIDETYEFLKAYNICLSTMKTLMNYGKIMLGHQCFASAAYFLPLDEILFLLQNKGIYDITESLQLCYADGLQLSESSRWNPVGSQSIPTAADCSIDFDVLDAFDVESKLGGLVKGMYSLFNTSDKKDIGIKVLSVSISLDRNTLKLDNENNQRNVTVASALFWFYPDANIPLDPVLSKNNQLDKFIDGCTDYFLRQLFFMAGSMMAFEIRNSLQSGKALAAIHSRLVDEVSKGLALQAVIAHCKSLMKADKPLNLSHTFVQALRRKGFLDSESSSLLYDTEMLRDEISKQASANDDLHRLLAASQLQCTDFTEFIAAINKMCSNNIMGQFTDQDALTPNGMLQAFVIVALNNFTLQNCIKLLCDLGYHEHVTVNLRSLIISIFDENADKEIISWMHRADLFMNAAITASEFIENGEIHSNDSLVIAWCLDQRAEPSVQGIRSWDMLNRALESTNSVTVVDKDSQTITTYNPINNCAVLQHSIQHHSNPAAAIAIDYTHMLVHTMGSQLKESDLFKRLHHSDDNLYYQKWSDYMKHLLSEDPKTLNEKLETVASLHHDSADSSDVDTRFIDLISYKAAVIAGHHSTQGCLLLPYNNDTDNDMFYVGHVINCSHRKYKVSIPIEKLDILLQREMLNKPILVLDKSLLSEGNSTHKYIVSLSLLIEVNGFHKTLILLSESDVKPKASSLLEMKVLGDEITMITSSDYNNKNNRKNEMLYSQELTKQISCLDQTILKQKEALLSLEKKMLCKVLKSDITLAKDIIELEVLLKHSLPSVLNAECISLIRVTKTILDNHGSIIHSESSNEFHNIDDEKTAACLISNSTVIATDSELAENITGAYGIVYVPILFHVAKGQLRQEDALDDFDYCWVLKVSFDDIISMNAFKEINFNTDCKGDDICIIVQEIKRWIRAYRHKLISHYRSETLNMLGSLCEQFTNGLYLLSLYQNDGYISDVEGWGAAATQIFNLSTLNNPKQHIQSARLHWFVDSSLVATSSKNNFNSESAWYTCDLSNTNNLPGIRDTGSMTYVDNDVIYNYDNLQQMLRMEKWSKWQSVSASDLQATIQDSKGFVYKTSPSLSRNQEDSELVPCLFLSVGSTLQPTVFQFIFNKGSRLMANAEDTKSVIHLLRESISQSLQFMQKIKITNSSLLAGECEARLTRRLLRIKSRCYNEICAEATSDYKIADLCSNVQALLCKQPGLHSVWLSCIDTVNGSIMYQQLCGVKSALSLSNDEISPVPAQFDSNKLNNLGMSASSKLSSNKKSNENVDIYWSAELPSGRKNTEFVLECREMAGRLVVYYLSDIELRAAAESAAKRTNYIESKNFDMKDYTLGMGYDAEILLWLTSKNEEYQQIEKEVFRGLCRTLARRIFELNKGKQNKQLLIDRKNDLMSHKSKLESADDDVKKLEATRDSLATQLEQSLKDAANLKKRLREEQEQTASIARKHMDVQRQISETVSDLKSECARKDAQLKKLTGIYLTNPFYFIMTL